MHRSVTRKPSRGDRPVASAVRSVAFISSCNTSPLVLLTLPWFSHSSKLRAVSAAHPEYGRAFRVLATYFSSRARSAREDCVRADLPGDFHLRVGAGKGFAARGIPAVGVRVACAARTTTASTRAPPEYGVRSSGRPVLEKLAV